MGKPISIGQSHNLISILANNVDWKTVDGEVAQRIIDDPRGAGARFTAFLQNGARLIVGGTISIDRTTPFNPAKFMSTGCSIWRGPAYGNGLEGEEQQCKESLALTEVAIANITLKTCLEGEETPVHGEEFLRRLKRGPSLLLDAKIGQTLLENPRLIPESWKGTHISLMGTELRHPNGNRCVLYLYWNDGLWGRGYYLLNHNFNSLSPAAVLG